jgi:hypothetical protein
MNAQVIVAWAFLCLEFLAIVESVLRVVV